MSRGSLSALNRLELAVRAQKEAPRTPQNVREALGIVLDRLSGASIRIVKPRKVDVDFSCPPFASFAYLWCPSCYRICEYREATYDRQTKSFKCPNCGNALVHAYVGAPTDAGALGYKSVDVSHPAPDRDYLILPSDYILDIRCQGKIKGLRPERKHRPIYSLRRTCPHQLSNCRDYDGGFCNRGSKVVSFIKVGSIVRAPATPSEGLTKPYCVAIFKGKEGQLKDLTSEVNKGLGDQIFDGVYVGPFKVWELTLFYLVGHNYAPRRRRVPVLLKSQDVLEVAGRSMETVGLLFKINLGRVRRVAEEVARVLGSPVDEYTVAHSLSHAAIKAVVRISGLSYAEFGESLLVSADDALVEALVYDNSPGGVGGVETVLDALVDFPNYLKDGAGRCPRLCMTACKACLYVENCANLNFNLSWLAANLYISRGEHHEQRG